MKESIRTITPRFSIRRMLKEYTDRLYYPPDELVKEIGEER